MDVKMKEQVIMLERRKDTTRRSPVFILNAILKIEKIPINLIGKNAAVIKALKISIYDTHFRSFVFHRIENSSLIRKYLRIAKMESSYLKNLEIENFLKFGYKIPFPFSFKKQEIVRKLDFDTQMDHQEACTLSLSNE